MGTVTIDTVEYQTYGTLAEANDYLNVNLAATDWNGATDDEKSKALVMTTRFFNRVKWKGEVTDDVTPQPLAWPRDSTGVEGHADGTIPDAILNGFWEMAALIIADPAVTGNRTTGSNVSRAKAGEAEVWFFRSTLETESKFPIDVLDWIRAYLENGSSILSYDSGTYSDEFTSVFDESPERSEGFM